MQNRREFLKRSLAGGLGVLLTSYGINAEVEQRGNRKPNIIVIMVDDMGFSDIGCYGGEIETPNLDKLAAGGLRFTQFYNTARCCPTRASILTGLYSHQTGIGHMNEDHGEDYPSYRGYLNRRCVTIGEAIKPAGYFTVVSGKWHVGAKQKDYWPLQRGFDRFYGVPAGGGFYYHATKDVVLGNTVVMPANEPDKTPEGWYSTNAWTDYGIGFIDEALEQDKPFFLYLAHNAPHWPIQAPEEVIQKYVGKYRKGWDELRRSRLKKQQEMGLIQPQWPLTPRDEAVPDWNSLTPREQKIQDRAMAAYAATVECMDRSIGKLVEALKLRQILDNTLILFCSDNGGCAEGGKMAVNSKKNSVWGDADSFVRYGTSWANASNTPFRRYKHFVHEGGISSPLIAHCPALIPTRLNGTWNHQIAHIIDILPTCLDAAGAEYPGEYHGNQIIPVEGRSFLPILKGGNEPLHEVLFWEHEWNKAIRQGQWKLVQKKGGPWELYNMDSDRTEMHDLSGAMPEKAREMAQLWERQARRIGVYPSIWEKKLS